MCGALVLVVAFDLLLLCSLSILSDERLVDVGDDSAAGDGRLDQGVQLLEDCKQYCLTQLENANIFTTRNSLKKKYARNRFIFSFYEVLIRNGNKRKRDTYCFTKGNSNLKFIPTHRF